MNATKPSSGADGAPDSPPDAPRQASRGKLVVFALLSVAIAAAWYAYRDEMSLSGVLSYKKALDGHVAGRPLVVFGGAFLVYVLVTGLSLPGAAAMTLLYAAVFGFRRTFVLVSFASTSGATIAMLVSRYLLHDAVQAKFGSHLTGFNEALKREGAFYLFTLRLIPAGSLLP